MTSLFPPVRKQGRGTASKTTLQVTDGLENPVKLISYALLVLRELLPLVLILLLQVFPELDVPAQLNLNEQRSR